MDIPSGSVPAGPKSGDGGGAEHPGSLPGVQPAPGYGAQDAGLLGRPGYRHQTALRWPKLEAFTGVIDTTLKDGLRRPQKQRHTGKTIFQRLEDEHGLAACTPSSKTI